MKRIAAALAVSVLAGFFLVSGGEAAGTALLKEKKVHEAVTDFILERTAGSGAEIRVTRIGYTGDLKVPAGKVTFDIVAPQQWEGWGKALLGLIIRVDDKVVRNTSVPVEVEALADLVVAVRPLERGEVIREGDVTLLKRDLSSAPARVCRETAEAVGKKVRVAIRANMPVRSDFLEKVPIVRYGQLVTIVAENGALRVTALGKAKGFGAEGDLVTVQNLGSNKDVQGKILDSGLVGVDF